MTVLKRGDTGSALRVALTDGITGNPVDLGTATGIRVIGTRNGTALFDRAPAPFGTGEAAAGIVTMPWQAADTDTAGVLQVEVEVTWVGGTVQTFPANGYLTVRVEQDLG